MSLYIFQPVTNEETKRDCESNTPKAVSINILFMEYEKQYVKDTPLVPVTMYLPFSH